MLTMTEGAIAQITVTSDNVKIEIGMLICSVFKKIQIRFFVLFYVERIAPFVRFAKINGNVDCFFRDFSWVY